MSIGPASKRDRGRGVLWTALVLSVVGSVVVVTLGAVGAFGSDGEVAAGGVDGRPVLGRGAGAPNLVLPAIGPSKVAEQDDVGDPFVLTVPPAERKAAGAVYVLYWTTDWRSNVPTAVSNDLLHWTRVPDSLPVLPSWAVPSRTMTWAPTVHRAGTQWVLYYSTQVASSNLECIGRAVANRPTGPFVDRTPAPIVCQSSLGGAIDPSVITDTMGRSSLLWKNDGNAVGAPVGIWQQPLASDGLSVVGAPTRLLGSDQAWEHSIIEGPAMLAATKGGWWLFYSGGTWQSNTYDTGVAWCATVAGPCQKPSDAPLLASTPTAVSPGGFDTFVDANGKLWASYSAFPDRPATAEAAMEENRVLNLAPVVSH